MNNYEVSFKFEGKCYREIVTVIDSLKARDLIRGRYHGCQITAVSKR